MNNEHIQADLGASAFLESLGYERIGLQEISPKRQAFVFRDPTGSAVRDVERYFQGAVIGAEKMALAIRDLKTALRVAKESEYKEHRKNESHLQSRRTIPAR